LISWARLDVRHAGLFTFAHRSKHIHLYQKFGLWPRFLMPPMVKPVSAEAHPTPAGLFSQLTASEQATALEACRELTDGMYDGLDVRDDIQVVQTHTWARRYSSGMGRTW
jgi:hypothetical protein